LYLMGLQNRFIVLVRWTVSFVTHGRGARLITAAGPPGQRYDAGRCPQCRRPAATSAEPISARLW